MRQIRLILWALLVMAIGVEGWAGSQFPDLTQVEVTKAIFLERGQDRDPDLLCRSKIERVFAEGDLVWLQNDQSFIVEKQFWKVCARWKVYDQVEVRRLYGGQNRDRLLMVNLTTGTRAVVSYAGRQSELKPLPGQ